MKKTAFLLFAILSIIACSSAKKNTVSKSTETPNTDTTTLITFERGICYGKCPAFKVKVKANGQATYFGKRFAPYEGMHQSEFTTEEIEKILKKAIEVKFFDMNDNYDSGASDLPAVTTSISYNGHIHTVKARGKMPEGLRELNKLIEEIIKTKEWKKTGK